MKILIVDDVREFCLTLGGIIKGEGWEYHAIQNPDEALEYLRHNHQNVALMLLDVVFKGYTLDGLGVLAEARRLYPQLPIVMISGESTVETAAKATKMGAENFISKGNISSETLKEVLYTAMERVKAPAENEEFLRSINESGLIGKSQAMQKVAGQIARFGRTDLSVLITGETGTGKKLAAEALHKASRRSKEKFVTADIVNIPKDLFQSELFGHVKGAFTGALDDRNGLFRAAKGGTLFLDEIGDLPIDLQSKLLLPIANRVVRRLGSEVDEKVDVRFVSATDKDLAKAMHDEKFRPQLYERLRECEIVLPPLRERREDIPLIIDYYARKHNKETSEQRFFSPSAVAYLQGLPWTRNVRELENLLRVTLQTAAQDAIDVRDIVENNPSLGAPPATHNGARANAAPASVATLPAGKTMREYEDELKKQKLIATLEECKGNVTSVSARLEVSRETIHQWMRKYKLDSKDFKKKANV